jgi:nitrogen regulatory protein P-II 1
MKKLEIIIKPDRLDELKAVLHKCDVGGLMISNIMGYGNQLGYTAQYRGTKYSVNLLPKIRVETVIEDSLVEKIIGNITDEISTGNVGDGKIFVYNVEDAVRIRTGERGKQAL